MAGWCNRVRARQGSATCGPTVPVQSQPHSGGMSMPPSRPPSVTEPDGASSTPPSRIPSGLLRRRTAAPHRLHTSPSLISCDAFMTRTVATAGYGRRQHDSPFGRWEDTEDVQRDRSAELDGSNDLVRSAARWFGPMQRDSGRRPGWCHRLRPDPRAVGDRAPRQREDDTDQRRAAIRRPPYRPGPSLTGPSRLS